MICSSPGGSITLVSSYPFLYARELPREEKLRQREKIFQSLEEDFKETKGRFKTDPYKDLEKVDLNNAVLMAYWQYVHGLERFEVLYEDCGRDLRKVVESLKEMRRSGQKPAGFQCAGD